MILTTKHPDLVAIVRTTATQVAGATTYEVNFSGQICTHIVEKDPDDGSPVWNRVLVDEDREFTAEGEDSYVQLIAWAEKESLAIEEETKAEFCQ